MTKKDLFFFPDPLLTCKLLDFANYPDENTQSEDKTNALISRELYGYTHEISHRFPIYYESDHSLNALNKFLKSKEFILLKKELDNCINYLNEWLIEADISIVCDNEKIQAEVIFNFFLEHLKSDFYSDYRTLFYSEGKKNLEIIAVLIREKSIDLHLRKKIIINLLSDEGLILCAGGALSRLSDAAQHLKNCRLFTPQHLIKNFIVGIAKDSALQIVQFSKHNPSQLICLLSNALIETYEIHAINYLLEKLKTDLNLKFLILPSDPNVEFIKGFLKKNAKVAEAIYINYLNTFKRELTASNLARFISHRLYDLCDYKQLSLSPAEKYFSLKTFIEIKLESLGEDLGFEWAEIFSLKGGLIKADGFMITVAERLINSGWIALPKNLKQSLFFSAFDPEKENLKTDIKFRIYPNNIELSWVKLVDLRKSLLDIISRNDGINKLNEQLHLYAQSFQYLLQSLKDVGFFFHSLSLTQHHKVLKRISWVNFDMRAILFDQLDGSINFKQFYNLMRVLSNEGRRAFINYYPELVYAAVSHTLERINSMESARSATQISDLLRTIIVAGFKNFTGLCFKKSNLDISMGNFSYLNSINFSYTNLTDSVFDELIINCNFSHANLSGTRFKFQLLTDLCFDNTILLESNFEGSNLQRISFVNANLKNANFEKTYLINVNFDNTNLVHTKFISAHLEKISFKHANLEEASFRYSDLAYANFTKANLEKVNFELTELKEVCFLDATLRSSDFAKSLFNSINFSRALLENANLQAVEILKKANFSDAKLQLAKLSQVDFSNSEFNNAELQGAILTKATITVLQLVQFYEQGVIGLQEVTLVGKLPRQAANQYFEKNDLSRQAVTHLIKHGFQFKDNKAHPNGEEKTADVLMQPKVQNFH